jgi:hypothetical protein
MAESVDSAWHFIFITSDEKEGKILHKTVALEVQPLNQTWRTIRL